MKRYSFIAKSVVLIIMVIVAISAFAQNNERKTGFGGWQIIADTGKTELNVSKIQFYLSKKQINNGVVNGDTLRTEILKKNRISLVKDCIHCILDSLLEHPEDLPDQWKAGNVFFMGTVYREVNGSRCVRYLFFWDGRWQASSRALNNGFGVKDRVAVVQN